MIKEKIKLDIDNEELNLWIFHHYATPPAINGMDRPYDFGKKLLDDKYNTTIFSSSYLHYAGYNVITNNDLYTIYDKAKVPFVFVNTRGYNNNGLNRVLNMIDYYKNLFKVAKKFVRDGNKPDAILATSPHPLTMIAGIKIAKKLDIPCICEVRDFWPEVIFLSGRLSEKSLIGKALLKMEHWIYKNADSIIFLKPGDHTYLVDKKWDNENGGDVNLEKTYYINNGVNIDLFNEQKNNNTLEDSDLNNHKFKIIYTGSIRPVNNLDKILDTAKILSDYNDIEFLIYGEGNQEEQLQNRVEKEDINNVKLKGYIDKKYIPYVLSQSSVNILNYSQKKYNWSRGNSSNKLFEYMASGKPIISTVKMGYSIIDKYNCGFEIEDASSDAIAETILYIKNLPKDEYTRLGANARDGAENFDFSVLSNKLTKVIEETIQKFDDRNLYI